MKIMLLLSSLNTGGAERVAATLVNAWTQQGHEVHLVPTYNQAKEQSSYEIDQAVQIHWLVHLLPKAKLLRPVAKPLVLRSLIKRVQPDVVISFLTNVNVMTLLASRGLTVPVIVCERTNPAVSKRSSKALNFLRKTLYPQADMVTVQSLQTVDALNQLVPGIKRLRVIANPMPAAIESLSVTNLGQGQNARNQVAAMGRLVDTKQFDILISLFAKLAPAFPDWDLYIWGEGPERAALEQQINALQVSDRVFLKGNTKEPWQALAQAQVFAMTSSVEGFPNVLLEAMALGLPCVCMDCPSGPREVSEQGQAANLVPLNNSDEFSFKLQALMGDASLRVTLGEKAKTSVYSRYHLKQILQNWDQFFAELGIKN